MQASPRRHRRGTSAAGRRGRGTGPSSRGRPVRGTGPTYGDPSHWNLSHRPRPALDRAWRSLSGARLGRAPQPESPAGRIDALRRPRPTAARMRPSRDRGGSRREAAPCPSQAVCVPGPRPRMSTHRGTAQHRRPRGLIFPHKKVALFAPPARLAAMTARNSRARLGRSMAREPREASAWDLLRV